MSEIIEIEESFDPLREQDETLEHYASRLAGNPGNPDAEKAQRDFLKVYKALSSLGNLESGDLRGGHDEGDHVKAAHRENGFELSLLVLLYKMNASLGAIERQLERLADAKEAA